MLRGVSKRKVALLIFGPMLVETIGMMFITWMLSRAAITHNADVQPFIAAAGSLAYGLSSFIASRWTTPKNAPYMLSLSVVVILIAGAAAVIADTFWVSVLATAVMGACAGHYYVPFQINMSHVHPFRTLAWSVAFYNIAWSAGSSVGPFFGANFENKAPALIITLALILTAIHTAISALAAKAPQHHTEDTQSIAFASTPQQRLQGWICLLPTGLIARGTYATLWVYLANHHQWSSQQKATGLMCLFLPVVLLSPLWARLRHQLHEPWIMLTSMLIGAAGIFFMPLTDSFNLAITCALAVGVVESCVMFHVIYYTNADRVNRNQSLGRTETLVGLAFTIGPLSLGFLWQNMSHTAPFNFAAAILTLAAVFVFINRLRTGPQ